MFKINMNKDGIDGLMRRYQWLILNLLWDSHKPLGSNTVYKYLQGLGVKISRASVIFFLNDLTKNMIAIRTSKTGKGGHAGRWKMTLKREAFPAYLLDRTIDIIQKTYPSAQVLDIVKPIVKRYYSR